MTTWDIDASHSSVGFSVRHLMFAKVHGRFTKFSGTIETDGDKLETAKVNATVEASSIDTHEEKRDAHLRSADFFETEKYPAITFRGTKVEKSGEHYKLVGKLEMHGVTGDVSLDVEKLGTGKDPWGNERAGFSAKGSVDRKAFGLNWNQALEAGGVLVGEKVEITLDVEAIKRKA